MKLKSNGKGLSSYDTQDHSHRVIKHEGRSWSGAIGSYSWVKWVAISLTDKNSEGFPAVNAQGDTLAQLKKNLERYLNDKEAGVVQHPGKYGVC